MDQFGQFNSSGGVVSSDGKVYNFVMTAVECTTAQQAQELSAGASMETDFGTQNWGNVISIGSSGVSSSGSSTVWGWAKGDDIYLISSNINNTYDSAQYHNNDLSEYYAHVFRHELGHNLGLEDDEGSDVMNGIHTVSNDTSTSTQTATFYNIQREDLELMVNRIKPGTTNPAFRGIRTAI